MRDLLASVCQCSRIFSIIIPKMIGAVTTILYLAGALLALAVSVFSLFTLYLHYIEWKFSHIPSPKPASFYLGHVADIVQMKKKMDNDGLPLQHSYAKFHEDCNMSSIYYVRFLYRPIVMVNDPNAIREIVMEPKNPKSRDFQNKVAYLFGQRFVGDGVSSILDYDTWKPRRRLYDQAFKKSYLESLLPIFNGCVDLFIEKLRSPADGVTPVLMKKHINLVTLDVVSKVAFGTDLITKSYSTDMSQPQQFTDLVYNSFCGVQESLTNPFYQLLHPLKAREFAKSAQTMRTIGRECIKKRIELIESGAEVPNDILTFILRVASTQTTVDIEVLVDDFVTFYVAGQETTSHWLAFALIMLCKHPAVLETLQDEVKEVLNGATTVTADHLKKLKYTEQVLLETLRLHPPVIGFFKESPPDGLTVDDYHIPGGTEILLLTANLCRSPEYFDEPDSFNPDNFGPERTPPSSFVFFPFGLGHRACIGKHFAMMEAKMLLARLVQTYLVTLPSDYKLVQIQKTFMQPKGDIKCTLELR